MTGDQEPGEQPQWDPKEYWTPGRIEGLLTEAENRENPNFADHDRSTACFGAIVRGDTERAKEIYPSVRSAYSRWELVSMGASHDDFFVDEARRLLEECPDEYPNVDGVIEELVKQQRLEEAHELTKLRKSRNTRVATFIMLAENGDHETSLPLAVTELDQYEEELRDLNDRLKGLSGHEWANLVDMKHSVWVELGSPVKELYFVKIANLAVKYGMEDLVCDRIVSDHWVTPKPAGPTSIYAFISASGEHTALTPEAEAFRQQAIAEMPQVVRQRNGGLVGRVRKAIQRSDK